MTVNAALEGSQNKEDIEDIIEITNQEEYINYNDINLPATDIIESKPEALAQGGKWSCLSALIATISCISDFWIKNCNKPLFK